MHTVAYVPAISSNINLSEERPDTCHATAAATYCRPAPVLILANSSHQLLIVNYQPSPYVCPAE